MEKKELSRFNMYKVVLELLKINISILQANHALLQHIEKFEVLLTKIEKLDYDYQTIFKGATSTKDQIKVKLAKMTDIYCGDLYNIGDNSNNSNLLELSKTSVSVLEKMPNLELQLMTQGILKLLQEHAAALIDHDVTSEEIAAYEALVNSYSAALSTKEYKSDDSSIARDQLSKTFAEATKLLTNIDKAMKKAEVKYPELFEKFLKARVISDTPVRHEHDAEQDKDLQAAAAHSS